MSSKKALTAKKSATTVQANGSVNNGAGPVSQDRINHALWSVCDTFRGTISADTYKDYILTMLFLKYISDVWQDHHDQYIADGKDPELVQALMDAERFSLPRGANFYELYEHRHEPGLGERIDKALHAIEDANGSKLRDPGKTVFQDIIFNTDKLGDEKQKNIILRHVLEDFARPELNLRPSRVGKLDVIGNAYEYLIGRFAANAGQKAGEYYTPPEVSELLAELLDPQPGESICDPACGSGSLLMKCGRWVRTNHNNDKSYQLYGQEAIGSTWALAKMNFFLHGEDNHKVEWGDTLRDPKLLDKKGNLMLFDVVTANPPFSLDKWGHDGAEHDKFSRFARGIPPKTKGDYAFILHMIETMNPKTGRMGVVVPHGVLFRGSAEGRIRQKLIEENLLEAVIGLPEKLFFGTGIPAAILVFRRQRKTENVVFIDASREFASGKNQNGLTDTNIAKIVDTYTKGLKEKLLKDEGTVLVDKYAYLATRKEIAANEYNLNIPRYVDTFEEEEEIDLMAVRAEREELKKELAKLEKEMDGYLKELGYGA